MKARLLLFFVPSSECDVMAWKGFINIKTQRKAFCPKAPRGIGCLELCLCGIRDLASSESPSESLTSSGPDMEDVTITYIGEKIEEKAKLGRLFNVVSKEKSQAMVHNDLEFSAGFAENFLHVLLLDLNLLQLCQDILAGFLHEAHQVDVKFIS